MTGDQIYVHSIFFINDPAPAGLGPEFEGMGLFKISDNTGHRTTVLVEHDYALTACFAQAELEGPVVLAATAVRWLSDGWPEEWDDDPNRVWAPVYPAGWSGV
jgi:hypothetical protein